MMMNVVERSLRSEIANFQGMLRDAEGSSAWMDSGWDDFKAAQISRCKEMIAIRRGLLVRLGFESC